MPRLPIRCSANTPMWLAPSAILPKGKDTAYRVPFAACTTCHQDAHKGQFAAKPHQNRCEDCHDAAGWKPATYTAGFSQPDHLRFERRARRRAVLGLPRDARRRYTVPSGGGQLHRLPPEPPRHNWREAHAARRATRSFPGRSAAASITARPPFRCWAATPRWIAWHATSRWWRRRARTIAFHGAAKDCAGCHADVHAGQFQAAGDDKGCARCHTVLSWRPTEFDHSRHSTFKLDGAHERVPCQMCHNQRREVGWPFRRGLQRDSPGVQTMPSLKSALLLIILLSAPRARNRTERTRNPHGPLPVSCEACHTATAWKPIRPHPEFNHNTQTAYALARHARRCAVPGMPYQSRFQEDRPRLRLLPCGPASRANGQSLRAVPHASGAGRRPRG